MRYLSYLQVPYKHMGRNAQGVDCFGMLRLFYEHELGIVLPDYEQEYEQDWWLSQNLIEELHADWGFASIEPPYKFGDVILFRNTSSTPGHIGIAVSDERFIHMAHSGAAVNSYIMGVWARQLYKVYRHKDCA